VRVVLYAASRCPAVVWPSQHVPHKGQSLKTAAPCMLLSRHQSKPLQCDSQSRLTSSFDVCCP
jgi:hypothetical protein